MGELDSVNTQASTSPLAEIPLSTKSSLVLSTTTQTLTSSPTSEGLYAELELSFAHLGLMNTGISNQLVRAILFVYLNVRSCLNVD